MTYRITGPKRSPAWKVIRYGKNTLSEQAIQSTLKKACEAGKPNTVNDGDGLNLIARPDGAGWWRLRYYMESRENRLSLGTYLEQVAREWLATVHEVTVSTGHAERTQIR